MRPFIRATTQRPTAGTSYVRWLNPRSSTALEENSTYHRVRVHTIGFTMLLVESFGSDAFFEQLRCAAGWNTLVESAVCDHIFDLPEQNRRVAVEWVAGVVYFGSDAFLSSSGWNTFQNQKIPPATHSTATRLFCSVVRVGRKCGRIPRTQPAFEDTGSRGQDPQNIYSGLHRLLLVSHRGHSRPLTAPPRSVHAGRSPAPRAGARGGSEGEGVNCLAPLSRASSRGQTRAEVNMGARPSTWEEPRRRAWSAIAMGTARRGLRAHAPCLRSLRPSWNAYFGLFPFSLPHR